MKTPILIALQEPPKDKALFPDDWHISDLLQIETKSARSYNMDAEEIMGMFGAAKHNVTNATVCYSSCKMRAQKNRTVDFLDIGRDIKLLYPLARGASRFQK